MAAALSSQALLTPFTVRHPRHRLLIIGTLRDKSGRQNNAAGFPVSLSRPWMKKQMRALLLIAFLFSLPGCASLIASSCGPGGASQSVQLKTRF
jgi:hypothetical protein